MAYGRCNKTENVLITYHRRAFVQPFLRWKSNTYYIFWVSVCSLRYPECSAHAPCCHLWTSRLYSIFPHCLINDTIKKNWIWSVWFNLLYSCCLKHFSFYEELSEIWLKMHSGLHVKCQLFVSDFSENLFLSTDFLKILVYQISWKSSSWSRVVPWGQTDRHDEANSSFSHICEGACKLGLSYWYPCEVTRRWVQNRSTSIWNDPLQCSLLRS